MTADRGDRHVVVGSGGAVHVRPYAPLMTARETAEILGVSAETVLRYVRAGSLPAIRLPGGAVRVRSAELEAWLVTRSTGMMRTTRGPC